MSTKKLISIVSPAYNEEQNIPVLLEETRKVFKELGDAYDFEYILVNDSSTDNTWNVIQEEFTKDSRVRGISLSRKFGHQLALTAGLDIACGDAVIYCDSDLQHPPVLFKEMIKKWEDGYYVVHTKRTSTEDITFAKKTLSNLYYSFVNALSDVHIEKGMADFKLLDKKVLDQLKKMREVNRFLRGMVVWLGFKSTIVEYVARKRLYGVPWYNFWRNLAFAKVGVLSFSIKPLKYIGYFGVLLTMSSGIFVTFNVFWFFYRKGWYFSPVISLTVFNAFLIGIVLSCLGIMSLYLSYIYNEVTERPLYLVADKINVD